MDGGLELTWQAPRPAPAGYNVQISDGGWKSLPSAPGTDALFTDVTPRTQYSFRVRTAAHDSVSPGTWSKVARGTYVEPLLPIVRIDTNGAKPVLDKDNYVPGTFTVDPNGSAYPAFSGTMGIKGRDNTTWNAPKKPYQVKLDSKASVMGMSKAKKWVLLANYLDRSQLRTYVAGELGRDTELAYTPSSRHVEVIFNGEYLGVYQLAEKAEIGSSRVNIDEMEPGDISGEALTGGYLLEIDSRLEQNSEPGFRTEHYVPVVVKDPEPVKPQQMNYIRNYVQELENGFFSPSFADPVTGYRSHLDVDSFIDWYIVEELTRNQDAFFSSTYMYKPRGDKIHFGPLWDFDLSMGNIRSVQNQSPEGLWASTRNPWIKRAFKDPSFLDRLDERWNTYKAVFGQLPAQIEALGADLQPALLNDYARWPATLQPTDDPAFLSNWLSTRLSYLDNEFDTLANG